MNCMRAPKRNKKKIVIGLTGGFGSGKTTVAGMLRRLGGRLITYIDSDRLAHELIRPGARTYNLIVRIWGRGILKKDRTIDRKKFGQLIFSNHDERRKLEGIIHTAVIKRIKKDILRAPRRTVILDAPLLVETGLHRHVDKLIVVNALQGRRIKRLSRSRRLDRSDIIKRMKAQMPLEKKIALADFIIDNNGTIAQTRKQVKEIWLKIKP